MRMSCTAISLRRLTPPPPHLRRSPFTGLRDLRDFRSGETLVEVMVSILLLFIIFCSWAAMNNVQAVRKESFRYAAVEKAAGILDAMVAKDSFSDGKARPGFCYRLDDNGKLCRTGRTSDKTATEIHPLWPENGDSTVGYRIFAEQESGDSGWTNGTWGVVSLYSSLSRPSTEQRPFAEFRMLLERRAGAGRDKP